MKKLLTALLTALCITCAADTLPTFEVGQLVIQTVDDCAILSLQVRESFDAGETWTNSGNPVLFGRNLNSNGWFKVVASEADMSNPVYEFDFRTTSSDAVPAELLGSAYWYDSGTTYNSAAVEYDTSETYARWNSTSKGVIFSTVADVGNELDYPISITVIGTTTSADGDYSYSGVVSGKTYYKKGLDQIYYNGSEWELAASSDVWINATSTDNIPPKTGWSIGAGSSPAPTLEYADPINDYFKLQDYPDTITVSGAGSSNSNGDFLFKAEFLSGALVFEKSGATVAQILSYPFGSGEVEYQYIVDGNPLGHAYEVETADRVPPKTDWVTVNGSNPAPTLAYEIPTNQYVGVGAFSGTLTLSETTISCAWYRAETTCFDSLVAFLNCTEGTDAFRGRLHINEDGVYKDSDVWEMGSGGTASGYEISSTYGDNGAWCDSYTNAELHGVFNTRKTAMCFAGSVMAWLKSTDNMNKVDNVTWCHLGELPESPTEYIAQSTRRWEIRIPLEILFLTESTHA